MLRILPKCKTRGIDAGGRYKGVPREACVLADCPTEERRGGTEDSAACFATVEQG